MIVNPRCYVSAGLNHISASLNRFKPHVQQKQVSAGRNPTLIQAEQYFSPDQIKP